MNALEFDSIEKRYGAVHALHTTSLSVRSGEFLTLLGPSGSGKSTLLNIAAGHIAPDAGRVLVGSRDVTRLAPRKRNVGMVFQSFALFPHMDVFENIAYGLRARGRERAAITRRVDEMLDLMQLQGLAMRKISQLSGGQQQRVALARSLAIEPDVLLLDEPMGALDRQLRKHLQLEIRRLHRKLGRTMVFVTHDQEEALVMSDRIAVFREGRVEQVGTAGDLYESPCNEFVASFLGESNLWKGRVTELRDGVATFASPHFNAPVLGVAAVGLAVGQPASMLVRPERMELVAPGDGCAGRISEIVYLGEMLSVHVAGADGHSVWVRQLGWSGASYRVGEPVGFRWEANAVRILPID